jgi:O-antigen/teichoic acid export membrane protein
VIGVVALFVGLDDPTGKTLLVMAFCSVPLLLQDFWRFAAFSRSDARAAAANDALWAAVQVAAFGALAVTSELTAPVTFVAWAAGAAAGALFGMRQHGLTPAFTAATRAWARSVIGLGGWFTLSNILYTAGVQGSLVIVGIVDGRAAIGGLRSIVNLFGPAQLVRDAAENVVLPRTARALAADGTAGIKRIAVAYSSFLTCVMGAFGLALVLLGDRVLGGVFGVEFETFTPLLLPIAVGTALSVSSSGAAVGLRAARQGRQLASVQGILVVARVALTVALVIPFGVVGAAWGYSILMGISSAIIWSRLLLLRDADLPLAPSGTDAPATPTPAEEPLR